MSDSEEQKLSPARMAMLALRRLSHCQLVNGAICYTVHAGTGRIDNRSYNMVRMAGVAYSLCWGASYFSAVDPQFEQFAEKAVGFLLLSCKLQEPDFFVGDFSFEHGPGQSAKLGATALLVLALTLAPFRSRYEQELKRLVKSLLSAQTPQGALRGDFRKPGLSNQRYFSGEALLALARYGEVTSDPDIFLSVDHAFNFYRDYFRFDPHPGFFLWHIDCWTRMAHCPAIAAARRHEYSTFALELGSILLEQQQRSLRHVGGDGGISFSAQPGISTSLYMEALVRIAGMLARRSEHEHALSFSSAAGAGFEFIAKLQVRDSCGARFHTSPHVLGGFRSHPNSMKIRMDNDQHAITSCLALLEENVLAPNSAVKGGVKPVHVQFW